MKAHLLAVLVVRTLMAWRWQQAAATRGLVFFLSLMAGSGMCWAQASGSVVSEASSAPSAGARPMATGLIVKLKDAGPSVASIASTSVVRVAASRLPQDSASSQQQRLTQALQRRGVRFQGHRATAFAARAMRFDAPMTRGQAEVQAELLRADPDVEWVAVDEVLQAHANGYTGEPVSQTDPAFVSAQQMWLQPRLGMTDRAGLADFPSAWAKLAGRNLTPVTVAVLDSGVPASSELGFADMAGRLWPGYDFVSQAVYSRDDNGVDDNPTDPGDWLTSADIAANKSAYTLADGSTCAAQASSGWHGLHVTYALAGAADNGLFGMGALAPLRNASGWEVVLPVRVSGNCGASLSDIIEGMLWSAGVGYQGSPPANEHPARVINLSFGAEGSCTSGTDPVARIYQQTIEALRQKGTLVVASAGNGSTVTHKGLASGPSRPANCANVLAVTSLSYRGAKASYANFIDSTDAALHGVAVASGDASGDISAFGTLTNQGTQSPLTGLAAYSIARNEVGTSFSAPQAAAVAALALAVDPSLTVADLLKLLTDSTQSFTPYTDLNDCSASNTGSCNCTVQSCGSGVLDAAAAVANAITRVEQAGGSTTPLNPGDITVSFTPDRSNTTVASSSGSGGGGAAGWLDALAALAWAACAVALNRGRRQTPCPAAASAPTA
jgi:serine protease